MKTGVAVPKGSCYTATIHGAEPELMAGTFPENYVVRSETGTGFMNRSRSSQSNRRIFLGAGVAAATLLGSGCQSMLTSMGLLFYGNDRPAEFEGLKGKTVAVVCRRPADIQYSQGDIDVDIAVTVSAKLMKYYGKKKITIVDPREVSNWVDQNMWDEFTEVGEAVKADLVLGIDLESVSMNEGSTMRRGTFALEVYVFDCATGERLYYRPFSRIQYPRDRGFPVTEKPAREFYVECVNVVATRIAELFYPSDKYSDFAPDPTT